jgi:hypothetical protein
MLSKIISTKENARTWDSYTYYSITVQNEVTITNSKSKDIDMAIYKSLLGKCQNASIKYDSRLDIYKNDVNSLEYLTFKISVKAGEKQKFTYTYSVYKLR